MCPCRVCSLLKPDCEPASRFNHILRFLNQTAGLSGNTVSAQSVLYDNSVYLSEKHHADRNIALAYYMRESGSFGKVRSNDRTQPPELTAPTRRRHRKVNRARTRGMWGSMAQHVVWQLRPTQTELHAHLDLYFQSCSILINAQIGARLAGTLANGGICPSSSSRVFDADTTRDCLSLMYSCGMYNFSGQAPEPHTRTARA